MVPPIIPGAVCDCVRGNAALLVYVLSVAAKQAACLAESDAKTHTLNLAWLENPVDRAALLKRSPEEKREELKRISARRAELAATIDLEILHGFAADPPGAVHAVGELARLYFGDESGPEETAAMLRALLADRLFFERKGDGFRAREAERVAEIRAREEREARRAERIAACAKAFGAGGAVSRGEFGDLLDALLGHFVRMPEKPSPDVRELLALLKVNPAAEGELHRLLVRGGVIAPLRNYHIERYGLARGHARDTVEAAAALASAGIPPGPFRDLTTQRSVAIDERTTVSYDDAFFLAPEGPDGERDLFIHIAGAAAVVPASGPLWRDAILRATSVFFPGEKYEMFPDELANDLLSLVAGMARPALTARISLRAGEVVATELFESLVRVAENLDYSAVDRGETGALPPDDLAWLTAFADARRAARVAAGALSLDRKELLIDAAGEGIRLAVADRAGSRLLVEELMILANEVFATFLARHAIPAVYRHQAPLRAGAEPPCDHPAVRLHHLRRRMSPSEAGTAPRPHAGLGLPAYVQATSPIRRFADLLVQSQIVRHLRGEPPRPAAEVEDLLHRSGGGARDATAAERDRRRFLVLSYAEGSPDERYAATVVENGRAAAVYVEKLESFADCTGLPSALPPGEPATVRVARVDPAAGILRFAFAREGEGA